VAVVRLCHALSLFSGVGGCSRDICSGRSRILAPVLCSYAEAHKIKLKSDALEAWELEKWHSERQQDLLQKEAKFKFNKQQACVL
jgi:hypothetical protein